MVVVIVVAAVVVVVLVLDTGLSPSVKPVATPVVAGAVVAVEAGADVEVAVTGPRGLSMKGIPPPAAVVVAGAVLAAGVGAAAPKVNPEPVAGTVAAVVVMGVAKREGPEAGADWVDAGGAGVDEGLIPKVNPPPCTVVAAAVGAG